MHFYRLGTTGRERFRFCNHKKPVFGNKCISVVVGRRGIGRFARHDPRLHPGKRFTQPPLVDGWQSHMKDVAVPTRSDIHSIASYDKIYLAVRLYNTMLRYKPLYPHESLFLSVSAKLWPGSRMLFTTNGARRSFTVCDRSNTDERPSILSR